VVRAALKQTKKAALGKIAFGGREHIFAITAADDDELGGMMGYTMRYQEELRSPAEYFKDIKKIAVNQESLDLAMELIKRKAAPFNPSEFKDGYEAAVRQLVEAKVQNLPAPAEEASLPSRGQVVNLMDALRKSVGGAETQQAPAAPAKKPSGAVKASKSEAKAGIALVKPAKSPSGKRKSA